MLWLHLRHDTPRCSSSPCHHHIRPLRGQARYSRCSNTWHAVAQLVASEELEDILNQSNNAKDSLITKALKQDQSDDLVTLGVTSGSDRVQILKQPSSNGVVVKQAAGS
ncbi:hypothetical protein F5Y09DRAFT_316916 [Xylaria sp. FL1042]|nr:hypothetical protein F5Y09DRAFT_316916 [Xylaria sp. FL1042]